MSEPSTQLTHPHTPNHQFPPNNINPNPETITNQFTYFTQLSPPITVEAARPAEEQDYSDPEVRAYFQSKITTNGQHKQMAISLLDKKMVELKDSIKEGFLSIPSPNKSISDILSKSPIAKEQQQLQLYLSQKSELQKELKRMEEIIQSSTASETHSPRRTGQPAGVSLTPEEHHQFIERITQIKKQIEKKKKMHAEIEQRRAKELQRKEEEAMKEQEEKLLAEKKSQAQQRMQQMLRRRQKLNEEQIQSRKRFKSVLEKKHLHQQMQQEYHKKIYLPIIQERSKILAERSKKLKEIKIQDILQYEKQYIKKKQERQEFSRNKSTSNWQYKHPPYSSKMIKILEEEKINEAIKEQQEKRRVQQLKSRQQNYKQYLKERFLSVKIDEKKREEMEKILSKEKLKKQSPSQASVKDMGNKYLLEAKTKTKNIQKDKKESHSSYEQASKKTPSRQSYKIKSSTSMSNYESSSTSQIKTNKIDSIIGSRSISQHQKMKKLQLEIQRLSEKAQRKQLLNKHKPKGKETDEEDLQNIVNSIKAKMSFIELYNK